MQINDQVVVEREHLTMLFDALHANGYQTIGPTVRDGAIVYDQLRSVDDLPIGWTDEQAAGVYRLKPRGDAACFGYTLGAQSWKQWLHPPVVRHWHGTRSADAVEISVEDEPVPKWAFIGVRPCELQAIAIQDRVFLNGPYVDRTYKARREQTLLVAVNCTQAGGTCFCVSMDSGPRATGGFDLALTEVLTADRHYFVVAVGSERGATLLAAVPSTPASDHERAAAAQLEAAAAAVMGRTLETRGLKELLYASYEHPRWNGVAERCLSCGNCTMVCPTCFCTTVADTTDLTGQTLERTSRWDSCFTLDFTYTAGGPIRLSTRSRYRQWMLHKLATWIDQFGTSGCVGCGRCITWCPVGIDITAEARAIREQAPGADPTAPGGEL